MIDEIELGGYMPLPTPEPGARVKEKLRHLHGRAERRPQLMLDGSLLTPGEELTQPDIDFVNEQLTDAVRTLAIGYGCAPQDAEQIAVRYWQYTNPYNSRRIDHMWGLFYRSDQHDYKTGDAKHKVPTKVGEFIDDVEWALNGVALDPANWDFDGSRGEPVGFSEGNTRNYALIRGRTQQVLLPIVKVIQQLDPTFQLQVRAPRPHTTKYPDFSDEQFQSMAEAPDSCFWVDKAWAQQELAARQSHARWQEQQSGTEHQVKPQPLRERLRMALTHARIRPDLEQDGPQRG